MRIAPCWRALLATKHHLSTVLIILIFGWLLGATSLVGMSLHTSWNLENKGHTINEIGSLRKRVYRMMLYAFDAERAPSLRQDLRDFEQILHHLDSVAPEDFVKHKRYAQLQQDLPRVQQLFLAFKRQMLKHGRSPEALSHQDYVRTGAQLEQGIDQVVLLFEEDNTDSIRFLRIYQYALIVMAILSAALSLFLLRYLVIQPLYTLWRGMDKIRQGDFAVRIPININNEFGSVTRGFNRMAAQINSMYTHLEEMVQAKTIRLSKRNRSLAFLYKTSTVLQYHHNLDDLTATFLNHLIHYSGAKASAFSLQDATKGLKINVLKGKGLAAEFLEHRFLQLLKDRAGSTSANLENLRLQRCSDLPLNLAQHTALQKAGLDTYMSLLIEQSNGNAGVLVLFFAERQVLNKHSIQLLKTIAAQFAIALENLRLNQLNKYLAVLEERNFMAQGLHDSIAQNLSFLNMQMQVLEKSLQKQDKHTSEQAMRFLKAGIQESYENVRELLNNFRVQLSQRSFEDSIQEVVQRFKAQTKIAVGIEMPKQNQSLSPEQQLQTVFILQEALSNIRKHASARHVTIRLQQQDGQFCLNIADDGVGFDMQTLQDTQQPDHVGTRIMQERAHSIHGHLSIQSHPHQGTLVSLSFKTNPV